jgi:serine protease Do
VEIMMKLQKINRFWLMLTALAVISLACGGEVQTQIQNTPVPQSPVTQNNNQAGVSRVNLIAATVQIYGLVSENGKLTPVYSGSGTIISSTGLILTNAHVASPASQGDTASEPDALAIGLMDQEDKPPVFQYFAQVKAVDGYLDLAVLQISSTMDGASIDPNSLNLPFVSLGNSDQIHVGDHVSIFGFPGIGGETITFTDGNVSGFTAEDGIGDRAWIKTDATISGGNSGGLAASDAGYIIGVPTSASAGTGGNVTDCRVVQDTNGDGQLDSRDTCIPIGGFINGLRPINLALPLIKASQSGQQYSSPFGGPQQANSSGNGQESFTQVAWYTGSGGADCQLGNPVNSLPTGINSIAAKFNFSGMTDGEPWGEKWTVDGGELYSSNYSWSLGSNGNTYTCLFSEQQPLPDGNYHLELYAGQNLDKIAQADVVVGGTAGNNQPPNNSQGVITVYGQVYNANSNNPLPGAAIFVLVPGVTFDQWKTSNFDENSVFTSAKSDNQGNYSLPVKLAVNVGYTIVAFLDGFTINYGDGITFTSQDPVQYKLDVPLSN